MAKKKSMSPMKSSKDKATQIHDPQNRGQAKEHLTSIHAKNMADGPHKGGNDFEQNKDGGF